MVLATSRYNAAYFGDTAESSGLKDVAGYTGGYLERAGERYRFDEGQEQSPYNPILKNAVSIGINFDVSNKKILDIGGAVGFVGEYLKDDGASIYDVLDVSNWCFRHAIPIVDNFLEGDALTILPTLKNNEYDIIISRQFLDCIDDTNLPTLISEMNRVSKTKQWHWVTETINRADTRDLYNLKTIQQWSTQGWDSGTSIISHNTGSSVTVL